MNPGSTVTLPSGLWRDGEYHRQIGLRPLTGEDEAFLQESGDLMPAAERTSALLARCMTQLGHRALEGAEAGVLARSLTVGDREALLLHLRRLTVGERLLCVLQCPEQGCGELMDLELQVADLILPPYAEPHPEYDLVIGDNGSERRVRFRLPTGADQEAIAPLAGTDVEAAANLLLQRCLLEFESVQSEELPAAIQRGLAPAMKALDPQAELLLNMSCPSCGKPFSALFDTAAYFFKEIADRSAHLYRQVHLLAFYYHWSEAEIMGMTGNKRQRYLDLLAESLGEGVAA